MSLARWRQWFWLGAELPRFLSDPVTPDVARTRLQARLARRDECFLEVARRGIYDHARSPYRALLQHAGYDYDALRTAVCRDGLEPTLAMLRNAGVVVSLDELKGRAPIERPGLRVETRDHDFDNPIAGPGPIAGSTSGTRQRAVRVTYDWPFIAEEAENESVLYTDHGVDDAPVALWYPLRAGIAGIHNLLMNLKRHRPPARWFTQTRGRSAREWAMIAAITAAARRHGMRVPPPEVIPLEEAGRVATWMSETRHKHGRAVVRTFTSSATRIAEAACAQGIDLEGCLIFVGGEPLTRDHHSAITASGARAIGRYVSTETGLIAAGCTARTTHDAMHVYTDRVAIVPGTDATGGRSTLLLTTLLPSASKLLLNTDLGDVAAIHRASCACALGRLGMSLHVTAVGSTERLTAEGVAVPVDVLDRIVGGILQPYGATTLDYQFCEVGTRAELVVVVSPRLPAIDPDAFRRTVLSRLRAGGAPYRVAADLWQQAGLPRLSRGEPHATAGRKIPRLVRSRA